MVVRAMAMSSSGQEIMTVVVQEMSRHKEYLFLNLGLNLNCQHVMQTSHATILKGIVFLLLLFFKLFKMEAALPGNDRVISHVSISESYSKYSKICWDKEAADTRRQKKKKRKKGNIF